MASSRPCLLFILACIFMYHAYSKNDRKTYVVYMGDHPKGVDSTSLHSLHMAMAQKVLGSDFESGAIFHSYKRAFNGFVVKLTEEEAKTLADMEDVVSVFPNRKNHVRTTKSWDFVGLAEQVTSLSMERDIIVGVIDSGIWPESRSFTDKGYGPPPKKWKGSCHHFNCTNKIIGARYFKIDSSSYGKGDIKGSPRDTNGHGSHCASTVAGNVVNSVSLEGFASGRARGGVPSARIAVYKVCWELGCDEADILAAFDHAISDGVDVISISVGPELSSGPFQYFENAVNIGSFHAMKKGVFTSHAAGNDGPNLLTLTNYPPWLLSVAASSFGREFVTKVKLGNGAVYEGSSINTFDLKNKMFPLVYAGDIPNTVAGFNSSASSYCSINSVDKHAVKGKIVLCLGLQSPDQVGHFYGAAGVIFGYVSTRDLPNTYALPATFITLFNFQQLLSYLKSTSNSTATIFKSEEVKDLSAPYIGSFSSRGPNPITPNNLKPDIAAPGINVIASWTPLNPISEFAGDKRISEYQIISGTSMATPHAAAAAAYVKSFHPNWSPAMIKSALMTTATEMSPARNPEAEFAYGAGLINPSKASNPGLVYDISETDYVQFLCGEGYKDHVQILTKDNNTTCKGKKANRNAAFNLNLPSFALNVNATFYGYVFQRTVTNVGSATSTYKARVISPPLLQIEVKPDVLLFTSIGQKKSFSLVIEGTLNEEVVTSASLIWDDGNHKVRSPIVVYGKYK